MRNLTTSECSEVAGGVGAFAGIAELLYGVAYIAAVGVIDIVFGNGSQTGPGASVPPDAGGGPAYP